MIQIIRYAAFALIIFGLLFLCREYPKRNGKRMGLLYGPWIAMTGACLERTCANAMQGSIITAAVFALCVLLCILNLVENYFLNKKAVSENEETKKEK